MNVKHLPKTLQALSAQLVINEEFEMKFLPFTIIEDLIILKKWKKMLEENRKLLKKIQFLNYHIQQADYNAVTYENMSDSPAISNKMQEDYAEESEYYYNLKMEMSTLLEVSEKKLGDNEEYIETLLKTIPQVYHNISI